MSTDFWEGHEDCWTRNYEATRATALEAFRNWVPMRKIVEQTGVSPQTVRNWAKEAGIQCRSDYTGSAFIYGLRSPIDGLLYYVGKSADPRKRVLAHIRAQSNEYLSEWIAVLRQQGASPEVVLLQKLNEGEDWREIERRAIAKYQMLGHPLCNIDGCAPEDESITDIS